MRIGRRGLGGVLAGLLLAAVVVVAVVAGVRWRAAGEPHGISPPGGAVAEVAGSEQVVLDRAGIVARGLRTDRGEPVVRVYALPAGSPWLQSRKIVATQLDHWEQLGDCADDPAARVLECAWREPVRWWPREVRLTMLRPAAEGGQIYVVIGSGRGE